ncbi:MAG: thioredoxin family protein [Granulosicoccaceae bacterium]
MATLEPLNQFEFHHHLQTQPGISMVVFTSPRCASCKAIKQAIHDYTDTDLPVSFYEIDAVAESALVNEFGVQLLPAMYLFLEGQFHCELHAQPLPGALAAAIRAALQQPAMEAP